MGSFDLLNKWDISIRDSLGKYELGVGSDNFEDIADLRPTFSFDYLSLDHKTFGFTGKLLGNKDYKKLLKALKKISKLPYRVLNQEYQYHFHDIKWEDVSLSKSDFYKCIYEEQYNGEDDITPYQFKVYEEARIIGFVYRGVFYLVMFDRGHNAYKRKK